jgi:microcystin-dependent protein
MPNPVNLQSGFPKNASPFTVSKDAEGRPLDGLIQRPWLLLLMSLWNRTGQASGGGAVLSGSFTLWAGTDIPDGYLLCDGSAISRVDYPILFGAIGTTWGPGDGSSTFNLPNLVGKFILGASGTHPVGSTGGSATSTLTTPNLPAHNHPVVDPGHFHNITDPQHHHTAATTASLGTTGTDPVSAVAGNTGDSATGISINSATTGVTTGNTGAGTPFSILPPFAAMLPIIKF